MEHAVYLVLAFRCHRLPRICLWSFFPCKVTVPYIKQDGCHTGQKKPLPKSILENIKNIFKVQFVVEISLMKKRGGDRAERQKMSTLEQQGTAAKSSDTFSLCGIRAIEDRDAGYCASRLRATASPCAPPPAMRASSSWRAALSSGRQSVKVALSRMVLLI